MLGSSLATGSPSGLVPLPEKVRWTGEEFLLRDGAMVACPDPAAAGVAKILQAELAGLGIRLNVESAAQAPQTAAGIRLRLDGAGKKLGPEGYKLRVGRHGIEIRANAPAGLFYGVQTLLQLLPTGPCPAASESLAVPGVEITDRPRFAWRGMHLDVGRHIFPVEFVKRYIDLLARHRMNTFHWHLTDDQGWRIEIKRYPRLTEVGAWRTESDGSRYGGFYTQAEVREVVAYAAERFVTVVPEIELPGHARAALAAYPEYSCTGEALPVPATWGIFEDVYCAGDDATITFLENILAEVADLFPGPWFHVGGDECPKDRWKACPRCQARMRQEGLKDEMELQSWFVRRIETFLTERGKRLVGWDEILEGGLPPRATVMSWRGTEGGIQAARSGHDVVMSPTSHCYFDYHQDREGGPEAIGGYIPLEKVYAFEPVPPELSKKEARHILGGQGNVWTEYMNDPARVEYMAFPRLCAMAEVLWSPPKGRDYADFTRRMAGHYGRLDALAVNYHVPAPGGFAPRNILLEDQVRVPLSSAVAGAAIRYTLDGSDPAAGSPRYEQPLEITGRPPTELRARLELPTGRLGTVAKGRFETRALREPVSAEGLIKGIRWSWYKIDPAEELDRLPPAAAATGRVERFELPDPAPGEDGLMVWSGFVEAPRDGVYTFACAARGWSYLWIGDERVVANNVRAPAVDLEGPVALKRGWHPITVAAVLRGGDFLRVSVVGPGTPKQEIPAKRLKSEGGH